MSRPRMRPEFAHPLAVEPDAFYDELDRALADPAGTCLGSRYGTGEAAGAILRMRTTDRHVWSPALYLHVARTARDGGPDGWELRGRFSPSSPVWTAFIAIYLALTCIGIGAACWGSAQWIMGATPWALLGVAGAAALAGFTYGAAFIGQGLGAEDMHAMRSVVERVAIVLGDRG